MLSAGATRSLAMPGGQAAALTADHILFAPTALTRLKDDAQGSDIGLYGHISAASLCAHLRRLLRRVRRAKPDEHILHRSFSAAADPSGGERARGRKDLFSGEKEKDAEGYEGTPSLEDVRGGRSPTKPSERDTEVQKELFVIIQGVPFEKCPRGLMA